MSTQTPSAIEKAVTLMDGVANLAAACGVSEQAVYKWLKKGYPPTNRCTKVEQAVGGKVSRFDLLPPPFADPPPLARKPRTRKPRSVPAPK